MMLCSKKDLAELNIMMPSKKTNKAKDQPQALPSGRTFPIVGIGASAGGLAAFEAFLSGMPTDHEPDMAFVLVQHLSPDHKSMLAELIQRYTHMRVSEVEDGIAVKANCVYIIPPNRDMTYQNGALYLQEPVLPRGQRFAIDLFFRSLAQEEGDRAIGIVLSGTGSDGTNGVRAIKREGGMVMVQTPESTEFDGMPRSAIATGMVDYELPAAEMGAQLVVYVANTFGKLPKLGVATPFRVESALRQIHQELRVRTGHDFSAYKLATTIRRIERRMATNKIETIDDYVRLIQRTPSEVEKLFHDLLIGVTSFFRDQDAFLSLEKQIIPKIFNHKRGDEVIRVWSVGCSTGEEAYSIAILIREHMTEVKYDWKVMIFATDIDPRAIATARTGFFPLSIAADITPERLARFFALEPDGSGYRVHKSIRDMLVFSEQDVHRDPAFSRLDLISCRNLLIYLDSSLQRKIVDIFHYALKPGGVLFLGNSEGLGDSDALFSVIDRKAKLFQRKENYEGMARGKLNTVLPSPAALNMKVERATSKVVPPFKRSLRDLTEQALLQHASPVGALVNAQGSLLYLHGRSGMYFEPAPGEGGINNILKMAREGLRHELNMALHKAVISKSIVHCPGVSVKTNGHFTQVNLTLCPVAADDAETTEPNLYLVILEDASLDRARISAPINSGAANALGAEVEADSPPDNNASRIKDEYLQSIQEELERANENLKSSNEELQSVNEELQSSNEEMETAKEELQSVNEELATVNSELQERVVDLSRSNNDMNNLLAGTGIGTVFVDHQLRILRFTPTVSTIINLIKGDIGRPVAHVVSNLATYDRLVADTEDVLNTLIPKQIEVQAIDGKWYAMRIQPYRTLDNVIEGAVITFVDITEVVRTRAALHDANEMLRLAVVVRDSNDAITVQDLDGCITAWNAAATRMYGWSEAEALLMNVRDRIPQELREASLAQLRQLGQSAILESYRTQRLTKEGVVVEVAIISSVLRDEAGQIYAISTTERIVQSTDSA